MKKIAFFSLLFVSVATIFSCTKEDILKALESPSEITIDGTKHEFSYTGGVCTIDTVSGKTLTVLSATAQIDTTDLENNKNGEKLFIAFNGNEVKPYDVNIVEDDFINLNIESLSKSTVALYKNENEGYVMINGSIDVKEFGSSTKGTFTGQVVLWQKELTAKEVLEGKKYDVSGSFEGTIIEIKGTLPN